MADISQLEPGDYEAARQMFAESLGAPPSQHNDVRPAYWDIDRSLVAHDERGEMVGVAARFDSRFTTPGGGSVSCAAVPNVGVRPDQQRRGVGRALLERQLREAADDGHAVLALNASETDIYGRFGYGPTSRWWTVEVDLHRIGWLEGAPEAEVGAIRELPDDVDAAREVARDLYDRVHGSWHGELDRTDGWWARWGLSSDQTPSRPYVATLTEDDEVVAYVVSFVKFGFDDTGFANAIEVGDLVGTTPVAEAKLLRWLCGRRLAGRMKLTKCNPRSPLPHMLTDSRQWHTVAWDDAAWVRVLDLPTVAEARGTVVADGTAVTVEVLDDQVDAVAGTWRLTATDGRLSAERSDAAPQLRLRTGDLGSVLWGYEPVSRYAHAGRVDVLDADGLAAADALLSWPTAGWCSTGF